jgi:acyl carrier protein
LNLPRFRQGLQYGAVPEWDSVAHMHLVAALEEAFDISLSDDDISRMTSFSEIEEICYPIVWSA